MRYPTDLKLLWEGIEKSYATMCELSKRLGIHRPRTKFIDVHKANLTQGEWDTDLVREARTAVQRGEEGERLCQKGTCPGEGDSDGGLVRHTEEHYDLRRVKARTKLTEILYIFFGIHTANMVQLADRIEQRASLVVA